MRKAVIPLSVATALAALDSAPVFAQQKHAALEEVIVTSRRVEESVQEVPLAVSALSAEALETKGVARLNDLISQTPSVTFAPTSGRSSVVNFGIRGQRNTDVLPTADPSVIVYIADVPQMRGYGLGSLGALDIQTVEVLKGPQGTLFGRSTTGGAIVITPNAPTENVEASVGVGVGSHNRQMARAMVNLPIGDIVSARVALQREKADGYIDNRGSVGRDAYNDRDELVWRASLKIEPSSALVSTFYTDGFESNENGAALDISYIRPTGTSKTLFPALELDHDPYSVTTNVSNAHSKLTVYGVSNTTSYDITDTLTVRNIIGYRYIDVDDRWDMDGTNLPILEPWNLATVHQYSEELQLTGSVGDTLDWITGVFWFKEYSPDVSYTWAFGNPRNSQTGTYARNISQSIFAQGTWHLTDDLNLTIGARANEDERLIRAYSFAASGACSIQIAPNVTAPQNNCQRTEKEKFSEPSYSITLDYHLDVDKMIYAAHRHGYRAGGFNGRANQDITFAPFEPETVDDLEIGFKGDLDIAGRPLRLNAAAFYSDYSDIQRYTSRQDPTTMQLSSNVSNAASAKLYGGEIELTWLPADSVQVDLFFSYLHARYDEWLDPLATDPAARDKTDYAFASPARSGGLTVRYDLPLDAALDAALGVVSLQGNVYAQSERQLADENGPGGLQPGYSLYGARIDWRNVMGSGLRLGLWGKNLGDKEYYAGGVNTVGTQGHYLAYGGVPRSWGLDANYDF